MLHHEKILVNGSRLGDRLQASKTWREVGKEYPLTDTRIMPVRRLAIVGPLRYFGTVVAEKDRVSGLITRVETSSRFIALSMDMIDLEAASEALLRSV